MKKWHCMASNLKLEKNKFSWRCTDNDGSLWGSEMIGIIEEKCNYSSIKNNDAQ